MISQSSIRSDLPANQSFSEINTYSLFKAKFEAAKNESLIYHLLKIIQKRLMFENGSLSKEEYQSLKKILGDLESKISASKKA